jgi:ubiquitin C-terminal hydrolase
LNETKYVENNKNGSNRNYGNFYDKETYSNYIKTDRDRENEDKYSKNNNNVSSNNIPSYKSLFKPSAYSTISSQNLPDVIKDKNSDKTIKLTKPNYFDLETYQNYCLPKNNKNVLETSSRNKLKTGNFDSDLEQIPTFMEDPDETSEKIVLKLVGLDNLGNTCYMNTALEGLIHCRKFISVLLKEKSIFTNQKDSITKLFYELLQKILSKNDNFKSSVEPSDIKRLFGNKHSNFSGYLQHDTQEFLRVFLEDISQEMNRVSVMPKYKELDSSSRDKEELNKDFDKLFNKREDSVVIDTFYGQVVNIFLCTDCKYESYSFEKFLDIPLLLEGDGVSKLKLSDCLEEYFKNDRFFWDTPCENKKCLKKVTHEKFTRLTILPDVLILSLQRYNGRNKKKNMSPIEFSENLDLEDFIDRDCLSKNIIIN